MKNYILFCLAVFAFTLQITAQSGSAEWTRYSSGNDDLSFEMPSKTFYLYDKDGFAYSNIFGNVFHFSEMQMIQSSAGDTYFCVEIYKVGSQQAHLYELAESNGLLMSKVDSAEKNFTVRKGSLNRNFPSVKKFIDRVNYETRLIASKSHLYVFTTWNRGKSNADSERFISSIKLSSTKTPVENAVSLSTLKPVTVDDIGEKLPKEKEKLFPDESNIESKNPDDLTVLFLPFPGIPGEVRKTRVASSLKFSVKFGGDGRIEKISLVSETSTGFNRNAFFSILRAKFLPELSNGKPITTERVLVFNFNRR